MHLEILSPEAKLFNAEVDSVKLPGVNGAFQVLDNHAAIISILSEGVIEIHTHTKTHLKFDALHSKVVPHPTDDKIFTLKINSGTVEMKDNNLIVLVD